MRRNDGIAIGAQLDHAADNPMSQRGNSGFNWPRFSITAGDPFAGGPEASLACSFSGRALVPHRSSVAPFQSRAAGVDQAAAWFSVIFGVEKFSPGARTESEAVGVGHPDRQATAPKSGPCVRIASRIPPSIDRTPLSARLLVGVGHEVQTLPDVRRPEARSAQIDRPDGVALCFQISVNKVEPSKPVLGRNLLAKDRDISWLASLDEVEPMRPKVPLIGEPIPFACCGERLARAATGPRWPIVRPSGFSQCVAPDTDAGEHVDLGERLKFLGRHISDISLVDDAGGNSTGSNQVAQPLRG